MNAWTRKGRHILSHHTARDGVTEVCLSFAVTFAEAVVQEQRGVVKIRLFAEGWDICFSNILDIVVIGFESHNGTEKGRVEVGS